MKKITISQAAKWLSERDNFLVLTHQKPDGDALGSAAGLCQGLREAGKTVYALKNPETTKTYARFIESYFAPKDYVAQYIVSVDTASEGQFQVNGKDLTDKVHLCIDHHPSNTGYAEIACVESERAACGEVIYDVLCKMSGGISEETATPLYVAVAADTGCFCYGNTNAKTLYTASKLVEAGAKNGPINKMIFRTKSKVRLMLEAQLITNMDYYLDSTVGIATFTQQMRSDLGTKEEDVEDIASIPGQIEGVIIGVTLREQTDGTTKVSVRTTREANANAICQKFGGGGHLMAAGCKINEVPEKAKTMIVEVIKEVWER